MEIECNQLTWNELSQLECIEKSTFIQFILSYQNCLSDLSLEDDEKVFKSDSTYKIAWCLSSTLVIT